MAAPGLLMVEFLMWVSKRRRTYDETMDAWRSTCPRMTIWEDALSDGLVKVEPHRSEVSLTSRGSAVLESRAANGLEKPPDESNPPLRRTA